MKRKVPVRRVNECTTSRRLGDSTRAIQTQIPRAMDVDVVIHPALNDGGYEIARDLVEDGRKRHVVEHGLLGLRQQTAAFGGIARLVRGGHERVEARTVVFAG